MASPATATVSTSTGPEAWVAVDESPYARRTSAVVVRPVDVSYGVAVDFRHRISWHSFEITHRSLDPVSIGRESENKYYLTALMDHASGLGGHACIHGLRLPRSVNERNGSPRTQVDGRRSIANLQCNCVEPVTVEKVRITRTDISIRLRDTLNSTYKSWRSPSPMDSENELLSCTSALFTLRRRMDSSPSAGSLRAG